MASTGYQETAANGDRFMVLEKGVATKWCRNARVPDHGVRSLLAARRNERGSRYREDSGRRDPLNLLRLTNRRDLAELLWRINVPISAIVLALLAIPLSFVNPRAGRLANLILAP